jgi:hypothetical protein
MKFKVFRIRFEYNSKIVFILNVLKMTSFWAHLIPGFLTGGGLYGEQAHQNRPRGEKTFFFLRKCAPCGMKTLQEQSSPDYGVRTPLEQPHFTF